MALFAGTGKGARGCDPRCGFLSKNTSATRWTRKASTDTKRYGQMRSNEREKREKTHTDNNAPDVGYTSGGYVARPTGGRARERRNGHRLGGVALVEAPLLLLLVVLALVVGGVVLLDDARQALVDRLLEAVVHWNEARLDDGRLVRARRRRRRRRLVLVTLVTAVVVRRRARRGGRRVGADGARRARWRLDDHRRGVALEHRNYRVHAAERPLVDGHFHVVHLSVPRAARLQLALSLLLLLRLVVVLLLHLTRLLLHRLLLLLHVLPIVLAVMLLLLLLLEVVNLLLVLLRLLMIQLLAIVMTSGRPKALLLLVLLLLVQLRLHHLLPVIRLLVELL